ncbi:Cytochrome c551 peroxidase [hydrothermal vent metagenome]|uniref:Cytochrome c551 peroxidase n=1 Tax=hydrothermal vent metagenome TaxID=652676 RepID=A0A3B0WVN7_9ZZZZ
MTRTTKILVSIAILALVTILLNTAQYTRPYAPSVQFSKQLFLTEYSNTQEPIYPIPDSLTLNPLKVRLGEKLFHDVNLSKNNTLSCASCHDLHKGGTDNLELPVTAIQQRAKNPSQHLFNTPSVFNATFNFVQTWEGQVKTLEQHIAIPLFNDFEMGNENWNQILDYLNKIPEYTLLFSQLYPVPISGEAVTDAIAEFEHSLITPNSRFDRYLKGDRHALTAHELDGYQLFKERGCSTCHHGVNIGSSMFQKSGVFKPMFVTNNNHSQEDQKLLKVPSLRNIALTAPYFHDGSVDNLEEAIDIMAKHQLGISLSSIENDKIHAFLNTLTGLYKGKPL